jgi:hypothetical protein
MNPIIPGAVLSICAQIVARRESHVTLDSLFTYADAPGDPPTGSKEAKALEWLRRANKDRSIQPLAVLGRVIENYMEAPLDPFSKWDAYKLEDRNKIESILAQYGLKYIPGGKVVGMVATPSRTLEQFIRDRDLTSIEFEFDRALSTVDSDTREAVSAANNILESACKVYIEDEGLDMPSK